MKTYFKLIKITQIALMDLSMGILLILPIIISFTPEKISEASMNNLYLISHISLFFVMIIRPLADIIKGTKLIRPLVILRKGGGVLSASIIVSLILAKIIVSPTGYFSSIGTIKYWSLNDLALLAHLGDISAVILLITSNSLSKRIFKSGWKKIQKLSYLYFYTSSLYVFLLYGDEKIVWAISIVTVLTFVAFIMNKRKRLVISKSETKLKIA